jgi:hypothetical protein
LEIGGSSSDLVVNFECCMCIRNIIGFLDSGRKKSRFGKENTTKAGGGQERLALNTELKRIEEMLDYSQIFNVMSKLCVTILVEFKSPMLVWNLINLLTLLIEKCKYKCYDHILTHFETANFQSLLNTESELLQDALLEMCQALLFTFPNSHIILKISLILLQHRLNVTFYSLIQFSIRNSSI